MQLRELGRLPVSDTAPAGTEPRQSADYERLLEETARLSSLQGAAAVNWNTVVESAAAVLERQAKDIPAAVYLCVGLAHSDGLRGLADGVRVLADLLANWWQTCFPPLKRLRARVNMLVWWRERILPVLDAPHEPVEPALRDDLLTSLRDLDATLGDVLPDLPPLRDLVERVQRLEVTEEAAATPSAGPDSPPEAAAPPPPAPAPEPAPSAPRAVPETPVPSPSPSVSPVPAAPPADADAAMSAYLAAARAYAALAFADQLPAAPAAWSALYATLWGRIEKLPPADNQVTALPAPQEEGLAACRSLLSAGRPAEAAAAVARLLPACPLCLDAQHLLFTALTACGRPADAALVQREARALAARLPGLTALKFADGQPFADAGTRQWLHAEESAPAAERVPAANDETESLRAGAREAAAGGNLAAALDTLEDARRRLGERSARAFPLRMEQTRLLALAGHAQAAVPLAEELEHSLEARNLADWQPELCLEALCICHTVWSGLETPEARARAAAIAAAICRIRPSRSPFL